MPSDIRFERVLDGTRAVGPSGVQHSFEPYITQRSDSSMVSAPPQMMKPANDDDDEGAKSCFKNVQNFIY